MSNPSVIISATTECELGSIVVGCHPVNLEDALRFFTTHFDTYLMSPVDRTKYVKVERERKPGIKAVD